MGWFGRRTINEHCANTRDDLSARSLGPGWTGEELQLLVQCGAQPVTSGSIEMKESLVMLVEIHAESHLQLYESRTGAEKGSMQKPEGALSDDASLRPSVAGKQAQGHVLRLPICKCNTH